MLPGLRLALLAFALLSSAASAQNDVATQVVDVQAGNPRAPAWVRYLLVTPRGLTTSDAVMLFSGGNGFLDLTQEGTIGTDLAGNFLVRSRFEFAGKGLAVAIIDSPNRQPLDGNVRLSADYALTMTKVIQDVRARTQATRVWVVGTSTGTMSAANIAARYPIQNPSAFPPSPPNLNVERPNGVILTSSQNTRTQLCGKIVQDAMLSAIKVPTYVVAHQNDACDCSPASVTPQIVAMLTGTSKKASKLFTGGSTPQSPPCQAFTPHGFFGIESAVVTDIAAWMASTIPPRTP